MSALKKRIKHDLTEYFSYQWTGFPIEIQEGASRLNRTVRPIIMNVTRPYREEGMEIGKAELKHQLSKIPVAGSFFKNKPKKKIDPSKKFSYMDILMTKNEQERLRKIPAYLKERKDELTKESP